MKMDNINKQLATIIAGVILLIGGGVGIAIITNQNTTANDQSSQQEVVESESTWQDNVLTYNGQAGKTALELLQEHADATISGEGEMAYVTGINGVDADPNGEYWQFLINGESSMVGAGSYTTKANDVITWQIATF